MLILLLGYSNQSGWGMSVSLKGVNLNIHNCQFISNRSMMNVHSAAYLLSQESKLTRVNLQLNWCPSKSTTCVLKQILFQYLYLNLQPRSF